MVSVVARVPLDYHGRAIAPGETFGAEPIDALLMRSRKQVTWHGRPRTYVPPPVPPVVVAPPVDEEAPKSRRRTYRRRDLTAEAPESSVAVSPEDC